MAGKSGCLSASVRIVEKFGVTTTEGAEEVEVKIYCSIKSLPLNKERRMSCLPNNSPKELRHVKKHQYIFEFKCREFSG